MIQQSIKRRVLLLFLESLFYSEKGIAATYNDGDKMIQI
jgi:hypothetical protein